jgi:molybdopterin-guanine dinucleotide biosynthesis protein A
MMASAGRSAIVLAGGRSSRMGADKAAMRLGGVTMLERVVAELGRGFDKVVVVAGTPAAEAASALSAGFVRVIWDCAAFEGPVKALRLGLATAGAEVAFACACDLPFVSAALAAALCAMAAGHDAAIPMVGSRLQVLHAAYRKSCLPVLDAMIAGDERRLQDVVPRLRARIVSEDELRPYDPQLLSFLNVNTPAEYARAMRLVTQRSPGA